jgi:hypothetical protein
MTELLVNDDLAMDRINPYTATGTFGIPTDGGYKGQMKWRAPQEKAASWEIEAESPEYLDHMDPLYVNRSGPMAVKTGGVHPATSFMFPARKYQYDDGTTSWSRETVWHSASNYVSNLPNQFNIKSGNDLWPIIVVLVLLFIIFVLRKKLNV